MAIPSISQYDSFSKAKAKRPSGEWTGWCVYFVRCTKSDTLCKIGFTKDLAKRVISLGYQFKVGILREAVIYCKNKTTARAIETDIHQRLKDVGAWSHGEWFMLTDEDIGELCRVSVERFRNTSLERGGHGHRSVQPALAHSP